MAAKKHWKGEEAQSGIYETNAAFYKSAADGSF